MDGIVDNGIPMVDADTPRSTRRFLAAGIAALLLHAALIAVPFLNNAQKLATDTGPVIVDFEADAIQTQSTPDAAAVAVAQASAQVAVAAPKSAPAAQAESDFVIPTPKVSVQPQTAAPTGQTFKESGGKTGTGSNAPLTSVPPGQVPDFPVSTSPQTQSASSGTAAPAPAKGVAVTTGQTNQNAGGSLDLKPLDNSLSAGAKTGAQTAGPTGSQQTAVQPGRVGEPQIQWEKPEEAKKRTLTRPEPKFLTSMAKEGQTLTVIVSFTVDPEGIVSFRRVDTSCGDAKVDAAVVDWIRQWHFSADNTAKVMGASVKIVIQPK
jgi:TonB family protein